MLALVNATLTPETCAALRDERAWELRRVPRVRDALGTLSAEDLDLVRAIVVEAEPVDEVMLAKVRNLEVIGCLRSEPVNVDLEAARACGVAVIHTPGRNAEAVADFTLGLCLAALRHIAIAHHAIVSRELTSAIRHQGGKPGRGRRYLAPRRRLLARPLRDVQGPPALTAYCGRGWFRRGRASGSPPL